MLESDQQTHAVPSLIEQTSALSDSPLPEVITGWSYQLQSADQFDTDAAALAKLPGNLLVIDPNNGSRPFTPQEISRLKTSSDGKRRAVLAYLSIGEAESYRPYWRKKWDTRPPSFLGPENPSWKGNYKVRFWEPTWQSIMLGSPKSSLDKILAQGFDGVYLDIVDAYYYFGPYGSMPERTTAAADMVAFVTKIKRYGSQQRNFLVVPQNAPCIGQDLPERDVASYLSTIDGLGLEDQVFVGPSPMNNKLNYTANIKSCVANLSKTLKAAGKPILSIEYVDTPRLCKRYRQIGDKNKWVSLATDRALTGKTYCREKQQP